MKNKLILVYLIFTFALNISISEDLWLTLSVHPYPNSIHYVDIDSYDSLNIMIAANYYYPALYKSMDGGYEWRNIFPDSLVYENGDSTKISRVIYSTEYLSDSIWFVSCSNLCILKVTEKGGRWSEIYLQKYSDKDNAVREIKMINEKIGYCRTDTYVYQTIDGGNSWNVLFEPIFIGFKIESFFPIDENRFFVSGQIKNNIYKSYLMNIATQEQQEIKYVSNQYQGAQCQFTSQDTAFMAVYNNISGINKYWGVYYLKTTDSWKTADTLLIEQEYSKSLRNCTQLLARNDSNIFVLYNDFPAQTKDSFKSLKFIKIQNNAPDLTPVRMHFPTKNRGLLIMNKGKVCVLGSSSTEIKEIYDFGNSLKLYPNPAKSGEIVTINYPEYISGEILIHDIYGKHIDKVNFIGNSFRLKEGIPKGTYFIVITSNGEVLGREKFIVEE